MNKVKLTRRDFIKATAAVAAVTTAGLAAKEVIEEEKAEASLGDLEVVQAAPQLSCLDILKGVQPKS
jgi:anaerobic selenocysteine-containing dehydrogenase